MVIVINSVIGGFSWVYLEWLAASTVWLQVSDYSQQSDYTADAPKLFLYAGVNFYQIHD